MDYVKGQILVEYAGLEHKKYVVEQLEKLGLEVEQAFRRIPYVAVKCESKGLEEKIMSIQLKGKNLVKKIHKAGIMRALD